MKRVLIIDDAKTVRMYHRKMVEELGCQVEEAENGVEALEKALMQPFDLFLVDINMPKMDGYQFLKQVRQSDELGHVPAIMISTESKRHDEDQAYMAGANLYLVKPVRPEVLKRCVALMTGGWDGFAA